MSLIATTIFEAFKYSMINREPIISLNFDDGYLSTFTRAFPILKEYHLPATVFVITDKIGADGYMNLEQLKDLVVAGWEIGSHTVTHAELTKLSRVCVYGELCLSKKILETFGLKIDSFAVPFGAANREIWNYIRDHYLYSRDVSDALNPRPFDPHELKCFSLLESTKIEEVKKRIDECIKKEAWLILGFHQIGENGTYNNSEKFLKEVCEYIKSKEKQ